MEYSLADWCFMPLSKWSLCLLIYEPTNIKGPKGEIKVLRFDFKIPSVLCELHIYFALLSRLHNYGTFQLFQMRIVCKKSTSETFQS